MKKEIAEKARERLVRLSEDLGIKLRQTYVRVGKNTLKQQGRYAHARQFKRARKCQKKLRTLLGRVIRDVERQVAKEAYTLASPRDELRLEELTQLLERAKLFEDRLAGAGFAENEAEAAILGVGAQDIEVASLVGK